jgi:predicted peroxiredoxin
MRPLVIKVLAGASDPERCWQGFTVATMAVAAGAQVSMWLASDAVWLAVPGQAERLSLPQAPPLVELVDAVRTGAMLTACTQCLTRRDIAPADLLPGVRVAGAAAFVAEILQPDTQALTY